MLPHFLQRVYAARDNKSIKMAWTVMSIGPWIAQLAGVILGIVAVKELGVNVPDNKPFAPMLERVSPSVRL